jgi:hypothetical protein
MLNSSFLSILVFFLKIQNKYMLVKIQLSMVTQACNPSFLGGEGQDCVSRPTPAKHS